jgi:hypothetical protein
MLDDSMKIGIFKKAKIIYNVGKQNDCLRLNREEQTAIRHRGALCGR